MKSSKHIAVIGLGYVGLPLVRILLKAGFEVTGLDIDEEKIQLLKAGKSYLQHLNHEVITEIIDTGKFYPSSDYSQLKEVDGILICVPTPLTAHRTPELIYVKNTAREIARYLQPDQLVVLESTTYPGTTREVLRPILEESGLEAEKDFWLAYSPEREDPGNEEYQTGNIPKVVGADSPASLEKAIEVYERITPQLVPMDSTREAEAVKILENVYRAVNIALINELKVLFDRMDINIWKVIEAADTKPFGFQKFVPGPGLGGHCIPVDPFYLSWKARQYDLSTRFIELAGEINTNMPYYVIERLQEALSERGKPLRGAKILLLGVAYKKNVGDLRESPALKLIDLLEKKKAQTVYHDPHIPFMKNLRDYPDFEMESTPLTEEQIASSDVVLIVTDHSCFDYQWIVEKSQLVIDTRNATGFLPPEITEGKVVRA